jgi:hypothetical protein
LSHISFNAPFYGHGIMEEERIINTWTWPHRWDWERARLVSARVAQSMCETQSPYRRKGILEQRSLIPSLRKRSFWSVPAYLAVRMLRRCWFVLLEWWSLDQGSAIEGPSFSEERDGRSSSEAAWKLQFRLPYSLYLANRLRWGRNASSSDRSNRQWRMGRIIITFGTRLPPWEKSLPTIEQAATLLSRISENRHRMNESDKVPEWRSLLNVRLFEIRFRSPIVSLDVWLILKGIQSARLQPESTIFSSILSLLAGEP